MERVNIAESKNQALAERRRGAKRLSLWTLAGFIAGLIFVWGVGVLWEPGELGVTGSTVQVVDLPMMISMLLGGAVLAVLTASHFPFGAGFITSAVLLGVRANSDLLRSMIFSPYPPEPVFHISTGGQDVKVFLVVGTLAAVMFLAKHARLAAVDRRGWVRAVALGFSGAGVTTVQLWILTRAHAQGWSSELISRSGEWTLLVAALFAFCMLSALTVLRSRASVIGSLFVLSAPILAALVPAVTYAFLGESFGTILVHQGTDPALIMQVGLLGVLVTRWPGRIIVELRLLR